MITTDNCVNGTFLCIHNISVSEVSQGIGHPNGGGGDTMV